MRLKIAVLAGDGIGPQVMKEALRVLNAVAKGFGHTLEFKEALVGGSAYDEFGCHMPEATIDVCKSVDAILFGSVGGPVSELDLPKWRNCERNSILALRKQFKFAANLRPSKVYKQLAALSPLKPEILEKGVDILIVRELLGDCYFGHHERGEEKGLRYAIDQCHYSEEQVEAAAHAAFQAATTRSRFVTSVDKANVLTTSQLWREVFHEVAKEYPGIKTQDMLVDNCAMQLMRDPSQFDVIVTSNMFGDILSDQAAAIPGSLGLVASASLTANGFGLFEPPGGSAQDIADKPGLANPIAQILSAALMLRYSFNLDEEARCIENAIEKSLEDGLRTSDLISSQQPAGRRVSTSEMTDAIIDQILKSLPALAQPNA